MHNTKNASPFYKNNSNAECKVCISPVEETDPEWSYCCSERDLHGSVLSQKTHSGVSLVLRKLEITHLCFLYKSHSMRCDGSGPLSLGCLSESDPSDIIYHCYHYRLYVDNVKYIFIVIFNP